MKIAAASLTDRALFARVATVIQDISGHKREKIIRDARLCEDLGIYGDDGHALLSELHEQFEMDWTGLDLRVHFGSEGLGGPLPWQLSKSVGYFEHRPVTVAELMDSLRDGAWPESLLVPAPAAQRRNLYLASWVQFGLLAGGVLLVAAVMIGRAVGG